MFVSIARVTRLLFWGTLAVLFLSSFHARPRPAVKVELAFNLIPRWPGSGCTYAVIDHVDGKILRLREISERNFILIATGNQRSKANPQQIDYFEHYNIPGCEVIYNQPFREFDISCAATQQAWKLRYQKRPTVDGSGEAGWAGKELNPNDRQMFLLKNYGIKELDDYVIGEQAFQLLRDCSDPNWISHYQ